MQLDPHNVHTHVLIFETEQQAHEGYRKAFPFIISQFTSWSVLEGGRRAITVLDQPPPKGTWRLILRTHGPVIANQINRIQLATLADEILWNQTNDSPFLHRDERWQRYCI